MSLIDRSQMTGLNGDLSSIIRCLNIPPIYSALSLLPNIQDNMLVKASVNYFFSPVCHKLVPAAARTAQYSIEFIGLNLYVFGAKTLTYSCVFGLGKFSHLANVENLYFWRLMSVQKFEFAQKFNIGQPSYSHYLKLKNLNFFNCTIVQNINTRVSWNVGKFSDCKKMIDTSKEDKQNEKGSSVHKEENKKYEEADELVHLE